MGRNFKFDSLALKMKKRALIFLHYNKNEDVSEYIIHLLNEMRPLFREILFISNTAICKNDYSRIEKVSDTIILRENKGYDFGAWRDAILNMGFEHLCTFDSLTLMNDSCFGPLFDIAEYYNKMEALGADIWGNTNHKKAYVDEDFGQFTIEEHIQSYFMTFNNTVIRSHHFQLFWNDVQDHDNVLDVIRLYETQMTKMFMDAGFVYRTLIDTTDSNNYQGHPNIAHTNAYHMLQRQTPFIKVKNFLEEFHDPFELLEEIENKTNYPSSLIKEHLENSYNFKIKKTGLGKLISQRILMTIKGKTIRRPL